MKIIGLSASPRKDGNTAWTVGKILEGAKERGAETQHWRFSELDIKPCLGCLCCQRDGNRGCVINDDMRQLYAALERADALVLGAPVYMGQMSAQAKIFTDRLFARIHPRFSPQYKEQAFAKKLLLAFTQGNPDTGMFQTYFDYTKRMFNLLEFEVKDVIVVAGMRAEPACERAGLETAMKAAGSSLFL